MKSLRVICPYSYNELLVSPVKLVYGFTNYPNTMSKFDKGAIFFLHFSIFNCLTLWAFYLADYKSQCGFNWYGALGSVISAVL